MSHWNREIVWEYVSPYYGTNNMSNMSNHVYRAYRVPYRWVPQLDKPEEKAIPVVDNSRFRIPGSEYTEDQGVVEVEGTLGYRQSQLCVVEIDEMEDGLKLSGFTSLTTTASFQMGIVALTSKGWKTFQNVIKVAKDG